jgi:murein DD-endopeptidase MepM/ murein hydrolase activator NlpD
MRIRLGRLGKRLTRAHCEGAVCGAVAGALVVGVFASSSLQAASQDLRWLGRRLVEKRQLAERQRVEFARLVADVDRAVTSLEGVADQLGEVTSGPAHDDSEYELTTVSHTGNFLTPGPEVSGVVGRLETVEDRLATLSESAAFTAAVGSLTLDAQMDVPSAWPVSGRITSGFGMRVAPIRGGWRMHRGLDISASSGTRVRSAGAGIIVFAGYRSGYGKTVVVDHGGGMKTLYGHMSRLAAREGRRVREGDVIGYVGSTGRSTGPHLHFEVRFRGEPVNPLCYLSNDPRRLADAPALTTPG